MPVKKVPSPSSISRVIISPPLVTIAQSTAILRRLQAFGPVTTFNRSKLTRRHAKSTSKGVEYQEIEVVFSDPEAAQLALDASPFTVKLAYDLPNPKVEDPFNIRGLQSRETPQPQILTCRIEPHTMEEVDGQNAMSKGFSPNVQTRLHQSLLYLEPPLTIAHGLGVLPSSKSDIVDTTHLVERPPDLMTMYRQPREQAQQPQNEKNQTTTTTSIDS
ncbi:hypothetical protein RBB50_000348 [Rhinocladiella similis]